MLGTDEGICISQSSHRGQVEGETPPTTLHTTRWVCSSRWPLAADEQARKGSPLLGPEREPSAWPPVPSATGACHPQAGLAAQKCWPDQLEQPGLLYLQARPRACECRATGRPWLQGLTQVTSYTASSKRTSRPEASEGFLLADPVPLRNARPRLQWRPSTQIVGSRHGNVTLQHTVQQQLCTVP